jgi:hypothetical protein
MKRTKHNNRKLMRSSGPLWDGDNVRLRRPALRFVPLVKLENTTPDLDNGGKHHGNRRENNAYRYYRIGNGHGLILPYPLRRRQPDSKIADCDKGAQYDEKYQNFNTDLHFFRQIPGYQVYADKLTSPVSDIRTQESRPCQKEHCHIDIPRHGNPEEPQDSRQKDQSDKNDKTHPADDLFRFTEEPIYFSHNTTPKG